MKTHKIIYWQDGRGRLIMNSPRRNWARHGRYPVTARTITVTPAGRQYVVDMRARLSEVITEAIE